jgi:hypothetical protein
MGRMTYIVIRVLFRLYSPSFREEVFSEAGMRRPTPYTQYPVSLQTFDGL